VLPVGYGTLLLSTEAALKLMRFVFVSLGLTACGAAPTCEPLTDGAWTADGSAFGMAMGMTLTMSADDCTFTVGGWDMEMGPMPTGGSLDGASVVLDGDAFWASCVGDVAGSGSMSGVCEEDGSTWTMSM
jgi:hypothetical protein